MKSDKLSISLCVSAIIHILLLIIFCSSLFNFHFKAVPTEIEVAVCGVGDIEKAMGGTGNGKLEEAQPLEDTKRTLGEAEISEDDRDMKDVKTENELESKVPDGNNDELSKRVKMVSSISDSKPEDNGMDLKTEDGGNRDIPYVSEDRKEEEVSSDREKVKNVDEKLEADENKLPQKEEKKVEKEKRKEKDISEVKKKEEAQKKRKRKRHMIANLLAEARKEEKVNSDFDKLLDGVSEKDLGIKKRRKNISSMIRGQGGGSGGMDLTDNDYGIIKNQIIPNWSVPVSIQSLDNMVVRLEIKINDDGSIKSVAIMDEMRYNSDTFYHIAVDSARRAVILSSPLKIPRGKIGRFRDFIMEFNPKDAVK